MIMYRYSGEGTCVSMSGKLNIVSVPLKLPAFSQRTAYRSFEIVLESKLEFKSNITVNCAVFREDISNLFVSNETVNDTTTEATSSSTTTPSATTGLLLFIFPIALYLRD